MHQPYNGSERSVTARSEVQKGASHRRQVDVDAFAVCPRSAEERRCLKPETSIHGERAGQSTLNRLGRFGVGRTAAVDGCRRQEGRQRLRGRTEAQTTTKEAVRVIRYDQIFLPKARHLGTERQCRQATPRGGRGGRPCNTM